MADQKIGDIVFSPGNIKLGAGATCHVIVETGVVTADGIRPLKTQVVEVTLNPDQLTKATLLRASILASLGHAPPDPLKGAVMIDRPTRVRRAEARVKERTQKPEDRIKASRAVR